MIKETGIQSQGLMSRVEQLERPMEDLEERSHRSNVRIIGLLKRVEGTDMLKFLDPWLREEVAKDDLLPFFGLERAH